jgi:hypothetical protein
VNAKGWRYTPMAGKQLYLGVKSRATSSRGAGLAFFTTNIKRGTPWEFGN